MQPAQVFKYPSDYLYDPTYEWGNNVAFDPFWLVFPTFGPMTAALIQTQTVNIPNDSDFECRRLHFHVDAAGAQLTVATAVIPNITILINDSGSGRNLMNAAAPIATVCESEAFAARNMMWPKIFTRNSTISITLTNFDAAVATNNIRIIMAGRKIYSAS